MNKKSVSYALKNAKRWSIATNICYGLGANGVDFEHFNFPDDCFELNGHKWETRLSILNFLDDCLELNSERLKDGEVRDRQRIFLPYTSILRINVYE